MYSALVLSLLSMVNNRKQTCHLFPAIYTGSLIKQYFLSHSYLLWKSWPMYIVQAIWTIPLDTGVLPYLIQCRHVQHQLSAQSRAVHLPGARQPQGKGACVLFPRVKGTGWTSNLPASVPVNYLALGGGQEQAARVPRKLPSLTSGGLTACWQTVLPLWCAWPALPWRHHGTSGNALSCGIGGTLKVPCATSAQALDWDLCNKHDQGTVNMNCTFTQPQV